MKWFYSMIVFLVAWASLAQAASPDWTKRAYWEESGARFFVGVASKAKSEEEGRKIAWENALLEIIQSQFGAGIKVRQSIHSNFSESNLDQNIELQAKRINLRGAVKKGLYVESEKERGRTFYQVYVLIEYPLNEIEKEKRRLSTLKEEKAEESPVTQVQKNIIGPKSNFIGSLEIVTEPPQCEIMLDGVSYGFSNILFEQIYQNTYDVVLNKSGFKSVSRKIIIEPNRKYEIKVKLERLKGSIVIDATEPGSSIYVDNVYRGKTPFVFEAEVQDYLVRVEKAGFFDNTFTATVLPNQKSEKTVHLNAKPGKLTVFSTPLGAEVFNSNRERLGVTPLKGIEFPAGDATLYLRKEGYKDQWIKVTIPPDRGATVSADSAILEMGRGTSLFVEKESEHSWNTYKTVGVSSFVTGAAALSVAVFYLNKSADDSYGRYRSATTATEATHYRDQTEKYKTLNTTALTVGSILMAVGVGTYLFGEFGVKPESSIQVDVAPSSNGISAGARMGF